MKKILEILLALIAFALGFWMGQNKDNARATETTVNIETHRDTIASTAPEAESELSLGVRPYILAISGGGAGGEPRCRISADTIRCVDSIGLCLNYGTGAGGEPRCSRDSAIVEVPIIQRHYADSTYEAWISGPIDPRLDSLRVFAPTTVITRREWKPPKRWHIGPTIGVGATPHGLQPYIGVSITYSIISF